MAVVVTGLNVADGASAALAETFVVDLTHPLPTF